jgi:hypothetical protein
MIVAEPQVPLVSDPTVVDAGLRAPVLLAPGVTGVKSGTPLASGEGGYVPNPVGTVFAAVHGIGGDTITVYRSVVLVIHQRAFVPGQLYTVSAIDVHGNITWDPPETPPAPPPPAPTRTTSTRGTTTVEPTSRETEPAPGEATTTPAPVPPPRATVMSLPAGQALAMDEHMLLLEGA